MRATGNLIGTVSLMRIDQRHRIAELGIAIGEKSAWSQGYGSEAVRLMTDYALTFQGLHTMYLWLHGFNQRAQRAYLKAGYREAGRMRSATELNGERYDRILMDCTREDIGPSRLIGMVRQIGG